MHVTLGEIVAIGSLLGLLIVVAGVVGAAFRTSRNVTTISNYRDAAQSWEAKSGAQQTQIERQAEMIKNLQAQISRMGEALAEKDRQIAALQEQTQELRDLVSGRAVFENLDHKLTEMMGMMGKDRDEKLNKISRDVHSILALVEQEHENGG